MNSVPQYISSFELEEARLGQALQANKVILDQELHREVLSIIRNESLNVEYALNLTAEKYRSKKDNRLHSLEIILHWMLQRKKNGPQ